MKHVSEVADAAPGEETAASESFVFADRGAGLFVAARAGRLRSEAELCAGLEAALSDSNAGPRAGAERFASSDGFVSVRSFVPV